MVEDSYLPNLCLLGMICIRQFWGSMKQFCIYRVLRKDSEIIRMLNSGASIQTSVCRPTVLVAQNLERLFGLSPRASHAPVGPAN